MAVRLRVVSYNVHSLRDDVGALAAVVRALAPDVLIVQEAPRRWRWRAKCARLAHEFGLYYAAGGLPGLGNVIMTNLRVRVDDSWCVRYPLTPGRHLRGAAFARCSMAGAIPFVVAGSHLSTHDGERAIQASLLRPAIGALADPVILGVDLNETAGGPAWQSLADGLVDAAGEDGRCTFPAVAPSRRIDALLIDTRLKVRRYDVAQGPLIPLASDHLPVVADLTLPAPRKRKKAAAPAAKPETPRRRPPRSASDPSGQ